MAYINWQKNFLGSLYLFLSTSALCFILSTATLSIAAKFDVLTPVDTSNVRPI